MPDGLDGDGNDDEYDDEYEDEDDGNNGKDNYPPI